MNRGDRYNLIRMWIFGVLRTISASCLAILPVFFLRNGLTEMQISFYTVLGQTVNLAVSLSCSGISSFYKDSRPALAILLLLQGMLTGFYAVFVFVSMGVDTIYVCVLGIASLLAVISALYTIFEYKLPCEIMEMESYSTHVAYSSLFSGVVGTGISLLLPVLYRNYDFMNVATVCILVSGATLFLAAMVVLLLKPHGQVTEVSTKQRPQINPIKDVVILLKNRDFRILILPNFLRGFGSALLGIIALVALRGFAIKDGDVPLITAAANIGTFLSSFLYVILVKRIGIPWTGVVGGLLFCIFCLAPLGNPWIFLGICVIAYAGLQLLGNAIPNMIYCSIDPGIMSRFHTWRMVLFQLGSAVGTPIYAALLDKAPIVVLFLISCATTLLSTLGYYLLYHKKTAKNG